MLTAWNMHYLISTQLHFTLYLVLNLKCLLLTPKYPRVLFHFIIKFKHPQMIRVMFEIFLFLLVQKGNIIWIFLIIKILTLPLINESFFIFSGQQYTQSIWCFTITNLSKFSDVVLMRFGFNILTYLLNKDSQSTSVVICGDNFPTETLYKYLKPSRLSVRN